MKTITLSAADRLAFGADVAVRVDHTDLAALAAGKTGTITLLPGLVTGTAVVLVGMVCKAGFTFSESNGTCLATVGDGSTADLYLASTELLDGSEVAYSVGTGTGYAYCEDDTVDLFLTTDDDGGTPATDYNLNAATAGEVWFYFQVRNLMNAPRR